MLECLIVIGIQRGCCYIVSGATRTLSFLQVPPKEALWSHVDQSYLSLEKHGVWMIVLIPAFKDASMAGR